MLTVLKEMRAEAREFREETRGNFGTPVGNQRSDRLEARLAALEARVGS